MDSDKNLVLFRKDGVILKVSVSDALHKNMLAQFDPAEYFWGLSCWSASVTHTIFVAKEGGKNLPKILSILNENEKDESDDVPVGDILSMFLEQKTDPQIIFSFLQKNCTKKSLQMYGY